MKYKNSLLVLTFVAFLSPFLLITSHYSNSASDNADIQDNSPIGSVSKNFESHEAPNQFFESFKLTHLIDWKVSEDKTADYQNITISKDSFTINILRGNTGGEGCSTDKEPGAGIDLRSRDYTKFENKIGKFLYFKHSDSYIVCWPYKDKSNEYVTLTRVGIIQMTGESQELLKEAVSILKSLEY